MTIDEAIEILSTMTKGYESLNIQDIVDAQKLGIEALKRVEDNPFIARHYYRGLLPGETKE